MRKGSNHQKLFKLFTDIVIKNSIIKGFSSTGTSSIYMLPTQKTLQFYTKNWL